MNENNLSGMTIYAGFIDNGSELACDCGPITSIQAFSTKKKAMEWVEQRIQEGVDNTYVPDENGAFDEGDDKDWGYALIMFKHNQKNWGDYYTIRCESIVIQ